MLDVEAPQIGAPASVEVRLARPGPKEPQRLLRPRGRLGQVLDVDADDAAAHDGRFPAVVSPTAATDHPRVHPVPRLDADVAITGVRGLEALVGFALGWLAREDKIEISQEKKNFKVALK